ncbi:hypothetical protein PLESTB_000125000 [Pleodorina starrii]|uniref:Structural maintenance of chromosomes protein n=1 Tax=Pleodorina starrii TaxID=330485 RepID=A0A9W6BBU5_9CHLO|nr:hypothetical protein PLESTM_000484100 [Pleodorina starrii]GLC48681.1 hypothetical protein PLESTB_000125000 [Pleodorina starrii]GLC74235.1 hypothetical protein PLESTF_001479100 [Pleodorina starrii]
MYISEVCIEGFKSYANRVILSNFDECFNAITGLNGSGKSNILDSICFVLGIKNLSQVRATSLQELVYKQGQAGITKATVSITFRNDDPKKAPTGFEDKETITITRQVVIGGRNKYLINGQAATETRVADLFQSVQLNVNNPTFLIMQGRITKVLNMKPPEILALLEEASGTKMYEKKKQTALRTLEKKQARLEEIDDLLKNQLEPSLSALRKKCGEYNEYTQLQSARDRLLRFCLAYDHVHCTRMLETGGVEISGMEEAMAAKAEERDERQREVADLTAQARDLATEKEIKMGGEMRELKKTVDELQRKLSGSTTALKHKQDALKAEHAGLKQLEAQAAELAAQDLDGAVAAAEKRRDEAKANVEAAEKAVEAATCELAGAEAGDGRDESNRSLQERLADAQVQQTAADAEATQAELAVKHLTKQLADQRKAAAAKEKEGATLAKELDRQKAKVEECNTRLQGLSFDEAGMRSLEARREGARGQVQRCRDAVKALEGEVSGIRFDYTPPHRGFDASKVHGPVATLVRVKDPATALALEVAAGGKLHQVVVDDDATAKELLQRGQLRRRTTIIPLNKVAYPRMSPAVLEAAQRLSGGKARPAVDFLDFDQRVAPAVHYAFGNVFICQDGGTAKRLAFSREVNMRCVSLEGDDFNPAGTLTGGSRGNRQCLLAKLAELRAAQASLAQHTSELSEIERQLGAMEAAAREHAKYSRELELAQHSLSLAQQRVAGSEAAQLVAAANATEEQLQTAREAGTAAAQRKKELVEKAKSLEREIRDFDKDRGARIKAAQDKLKKAKAAVEAARKALRAAEAAFARAQQERDAAGGEKESVQKQIQEAQQSSAGAEAEVAELSKSVADAKEAVTAAAKRLEEMQVRLSECDGEIKALEVSREAAAKKMSECDADIKKTDAKIKSKREQMVKSKEWLARTETEHPWIATEKRHFGTGDYKFDGIDISAMRKEFENLQERCAALQGKVQASVVSKLQKNEEDYTALCGKRSVVESDKKKLEQVIAELDDQSRAALKDVWKQVNEWFGQIFSTLLPGTSAKLEPPEGGSYMEGLEVRVAFGSVWKESLTELSGGQRSLLALSLILALCRFKPAPIYILDEVDAALDLNHTQNIGRMIRENFPESQFIVVSLKEGMFANANVLFRTKFVEGVSTVTRTVTETGRAAAAAGGRAGRENMAAGGKAGTAAGRGRAGGATLRDNNR